MSDAAIRLRALDPTQSFIVQAPAGSGKTELLTQRILSLLAQGVSEPEEVLAITFTKKAAQEMRERVLSTIALGQGPCPSVAHKQASWKLAQRVIARSEALGWDLMNQPQRLNILTIDALCARLVRMMPILSKIGVMPEIAPDPSALYQLASIKTMELLLLEKDNNAITLLMHMDNRLDRVTQMIADMISSREQWLPVIVAHQQHAQVRTVLEHHLQTVVLDKLSLIHAELEPYFVTMRDLIQFACAQGVDARCEGLSGFHIGLEPRLDNMNTWQSLSAWLLTKDGELRKSVDKRMGFPAATDAKSKEDKLLYKTRKESMKALLEALAEDEAVVEAVHLLSELPTPEYEASSWELLSALIHILPQAAAMLMVYFDEKSQLDFSAIAMGALQALGTEEAPTDVSLKLDMHIKHMLVDEFQDTSFMQYELIAKLTAGWQPEDGRTLFLVGDPMQSIYRFRQAEVSLFLKAMGEGIGQVTLHPLQLSMNFRSHPEVIDWINEAASEFFPQHAHIHLGAVPYTQSVAAVSPEGSTAPGIYPHIVMDTQHEAAVVLTLLQEALDAGHQSIAILVRARSHLKAITQLLVQSNIPYQAVELEPLSHRPVIQQLLILTRMMVHQGDRTAWLAFLRSALCGCSLADITVIAQVGEPCLMESMLRVLKERTISAEGLQILSRVMPLLHAAMAQRQQRMLSQSLQGLWMALGGPVTCQQRSSLDDAKQYFCLLAQHETFGTVFNMSYFVERLEQSYASSAHHETKIQVMTIHKAKGLEFDVVILPGLSKRPVRGDNPVFVWDNIPTEAGEALLFAPIHPLFGEASPLYQFILKQRDKKEDFELSRLLYVALTRTRTQCHLLAVVQEDENKGLKKPARGSFAHRLWPVYEPHAIIHQADNKAERVLDTSGARLMRLSPQWRTHLSLETVKHELISSQDVSNHVDPSVFARDRVQDKLFGTVLHQALCDMANSNTLSTEPFKERWYALLCENIGVEAGPAYDALLKALNKTLSDPKGRWILSPHTDARCELALLCRDRGKPMRFVIDRTFVDEQGRRWIIDYKSAASPDAKAIHAPQLEAYARAIKKMSPGPIYCGLYFPLTAEWIDWEYQSSDEELAYG